MGTVHYLSCLWPGLPELWWRGRLSSLPIAIGFACALNFVLITRYVYPFWLPSGLAAMAFWFGLVAYCIFTIRRIRELPEIVAPRSASDQPDRFVEAQQAFLKADWKTAEQLLNEVLAIEHRDPPALLLLASVYRQSNRFESASMLMQEIHRLEVADAWYLEVHAEKQRLDRAIERASEQENEKTSDEKTATNSDEDAAEMTDNLPLAA